MFDLYADRLLGPACGGGCAARAAADKVVNNLGGALSDAAGSVRRWIRPNGATDEPEATEPDEDSTAGRDRTGSGS